METFTPKIFEKRLAHYEHLMALLQAGYEIASDVMENADHSAEERFSLISGVVLNIANFTDQEELDIDQDLAAHCVCVFMSTEDIISIEDTAERELAKRRIRNMYAEAKRIIREDSGVHEIRLDEKLDRLHGEVGELRTEVGERFDRVEGWLGRIEEELLVLNGITLAVRA